MVDLSDFRSKHYFHIATFSGTQLIGNPTAAVAAQNQFDALAMAQIAHHQNQMLALQGFAVQQSAPTQQQSGKNFA